MILGYIVAEQDVEVENFMVVNQLPNETELPILIVGREFSKKLNIKTSILDKRIKNNVFWTYSIKEKKSEYLDDLESFKIFALKDNLKRVTYFYIDPFSLTYSQIKKIINKIRDNNFGLYYYDNKMCYLYFNNIVFGIHWESLSYFGIQKNKIIKLLNANNFSVLFKDEIFNICMDKLQKLGNLKMLPYLYYILKHDKQDIISVIH